MKQQYISDIIKNEYLDWQFGDRILIKAPTGSGKSTFFGSNISRYCAKKGLSALMLSNRELLKLQNIALFPNSITCLNYQTFEFLKTKDNIDIDSLLKEYQIIFVDECHYFFKDSFFNKTTTIILDWLLKPHPDKIIIFASATPEVIFGCIAKEDFNFSYEIPCDYSYIKDIYFYNSDDDLKNILKNIPPQEKAIYFGGKASDSAIFSSGIRGAKFVCSQNNREFKKYSDKKTYNQNTDKQKFLCKILMTTTVLDNGVNVKDDSVKHIITDLTDDISIIQCIGRKRVLSDTDRVTLYFRTFPKKQIIGVLNGCRELLKQRNLPITKRVMMSHRQRETLKIYNIGFISYICGLFNYDITKVKHYSKIVSAPKIEDLLKSYEGKKLFSEDKNLFIEAFKDLVYNKNDKNYDKYSFKSIQANIAEYNINYELIKTRETAGINKGKYYWIIKKKCLWGK